MLLSRPKIALLATLGITIILLFPAAFGPFPVTYGPASALRAIAYAALVIFCLSFLVAFLMESAALRIEHIAQAIAAGASCPTPALRC